MPMLQLRITYIIKYKNDLVIHGTILSNKSKSTTVENLMFASYLHTGYTKLQLSHNIVIVIMLIVK